MFPAPDPALDDLPLTDRMRRWCVGRAWWWRLPLFVVLASQVLKPLREQGDWTLFSGIIFGAHEFGHLFFAIGGEWLGVAGGSLMQILVPIGALALVWKSRDWFGVAVVGLFLATSFAELSWYVADARTEMLDLVSFSPEGGIHDWNYLLGEAGLLKSDLRIARLLRFIAWVLLIASSLLTARLCLWMATEKPTPAASPAPERPSRSRPPY
ncbi:MAG: hypothetical protein IT357_13685 [Gemmatimonadaceae bacterium]|nr:hypothetical protein [Gemmatimonadaceae bacterium]